MKEILKELPTKDKLAKKSQFILSFVATKGVTQKDSKFIVLNKNQFIKKLKELVPEGFGITILAMEREMKL